MLSELIEKMKAQVAVKTAGKMDFKSESAEYKFKVVKENNSDSAEFVEDWARLMQKQMAKEEKDLTNSLLWSTYNMVNACHKASVDLYRARALLTMYWKYGNQIPMDRSA